MSWKEKCKGVFLEDREDQQVVMQARAAGATPRPMRERPEDDANPQKQFRKWVRSTAATAPWLALAIILFAVFAQGAIAASALGYGLLKVAIAVVGTVIADETMFRGLHEPRDAGWLPMIRRSMIFMGICWLMAVT